MQQTKSMFLIGNALGAISMTSNPAAVGTSVNDAIRETPLLSGPEILEGLSVVKKMLEVEQTRNGVDTERYDVLSQIQTTLIAKAEQAGLTHEQMILFGQIDEGDGGIRFDPALANQEMERHKLNGGSHSRTGHAT